MTIFLARFVSTLSSMIILLAVSVMCNLAMANIQVFDARTKDPDDFKKLDYIIFAAGPGKVDDYIGELDKIKKLISENKAIINEDDRDIGVFVYEYWKESKDNKGNLEEGFTSYWLKKANGYAFNLPLKFGDATQDGVGRAGHGATIRFIESMASSLYDHKNGAPRFIRLTPKASQATGFTKAKLDKNSTFSNFLIESDYSKALLEMLTSFAVNVEESQFPALEEELKEPEYNKINVIYTNRDSNYEADTDRSAYLRGVSDLDKVYFLAGPTNHKVSVTKWRKKIIEDVKSKIEKSPYPAHLITFIVPEYCDQPSLGFRGEFTSNEQKFFEGNNQTNQEEFGFARARKNGGIVSYLGLYEKFRDPLYVEDDSHRPNVGATIRNIVGYELGLLRLNPDLKSFFYIPDNADYVDFVRKELRSMGRSYVSTFEELVDMIVEDASIEK